MQYEQMLPGIDPGVLDLAPWLAVAISAGSLVLGWVFYYQLCLRVCSERVVMAVMVIAVAAANWVYLQVFSARAAVLHVGMLLGTIMVMNVIKMIIPAHIAMRRQLQNGEPLDRSFGETAKRHSQRNNYFTLPVLASMVGFQFAAGYTAALSWMALPLVMLSGVAFRYYRCCGSRPWRRRRSAKSGKSDDDATVSGTRQSAVFLVNSGFLVSQIQPGGTFMLNRVIQRRRRPALLALLALLVICATTAAMRPAAAQDRPFSRDRFRVEIAGITGDSMVSGFTEVSGLESSLEPIEYREGQDPTVRKQPGQLHNTNLVLRRGWTNRHDLWNWYRNITKGIIDRRSGTITLVDADHQTIVSRWVFHQAYPVRYRIGGFDSHDSSPLMEEIEITFERFDLDQN